MVAKDGALKQTEGGDFIVDGAMTIRDLNRATDWQLPDDEANTLAGLVIHEAQTIPAEGQVFSSTASASKSSSAAKTASRA